MTPRNRSCSFVAIVSLIAITQVSCAAPEALAGEPLQADSSAEGPSPTEIDAHFDVDFNVAAVFRDVDPGLDVEVDTLGEPDGSTALLLSEGWGGSEVVGAEVETLRAFGDDGRELTVDRLEPWEWSVQHAPGEAFRYAYSLPANTLQVEPDPAHRYGPIVNTGLVHVIGELGLIRPGFLDNGPTVRASVAWTGAAEHGWQAASSLGAGTTRVEQVMPLSELRQSLFVAGDLDQFDFDVGGSPLTVVLPREPWQFETRELAEIVEQIVALERDFLEDTDRPHYLVCFLPIGVPDENSVETGGTGLSNAFTAYSLPGISMAPESRSGAAVRGVLVHEMFHEWNGRAVRMAGAEAELYWFSEGFTEFFTRRLSRLAGFTDVNAFAKDLNETIRRNALNPEGRAGAERLAEMFWSSRDAQFVPYERGDLVACLVDYAIRQRTDGERSLDDLMRKLVRDGRDNPAGHVRLGLEDLLAEIGAWGGPEIAATVRGIVVNGDVITLPYDLFEPELVGRDGIAHRFDLGFDIEATMEDRVVVGVAEESPAWRAGLRDGQQIAGMSYMGESPDEPVSIRVAGDVAQEIEYLPRGAGPEVVVFEVGGEGSRGG